MNQPLNPTDLFPLAPMREATHPPFLYKRRASAMPLRQFFLCKERASAMPLRQIFVQGASLQRCPSGNIFVRGASISDAPPAIFFVQGASVGDPVTEKSTKFFLCQERALATLLPGVPAQPALQSSQTLKIPQNTPTPTLPMVSDKPASKLSVNKR